MKPKLTIWMYVDPHSTSLYDERAERMGLEGGGVELEYRELESLIGKTFPDCEITFSRDKTFTDLANGNPDFYLFDIGGMCAVDYTGVQRSNWCHMILRQLENHPSTGFVPWTCMTQNSVGCVIDDMVLGDSDEIPDGYTRKTFPNLFTDDDRYGSDTEKKALNWMRRFMQ